ncbi:MAG: hypothetical protein U5O39_13090 [Gammaproteobacteria bacterium]|nr:hypothetical protein [Gammaproteobacteria bacterium]
MSPPARPDVGPFRRGLEPLEPLPVHDNTTRNIVDALSKRHYVSASLDDEISEKIFEAYLDDLDPSRSYLLASDIEEFNQYRTSFDNLLRRGDVGPAFEIFNRYHLRVVDRFEWIIDMLEEGIDELDFTKDEQLQIDREGAPWAGWIAGSLRRSLAKARQTRDAQPETGGQNVGRNSGTARQALREPTYHGRFRQIARTSTNCT